MNFNSNNKNQKTINKDQRINDQEEAEKGEQKQLKTDISVIVSLDNSQYLVTEWDLEEFKITEFKQELPLGDCLPIKFHLPSNDGIQTLIETLVELKQREGKTSTFTFLNLTSAEKEVLNETASKIEQQQLAPKEGEIKRELDRRIKNRPPEGYGERNTKAPHFFGKRKAKLFAATVAGLTLGGAIFYYTFSSLHESVTHMTINSAAITRSIEPIVATNHGTIEQLYLNEGMAVQEGEPLLQIYDRAMAKSTIGAEIRDLTRRINQKKETLVRMNHDVQLSNVDQSEARLNLENARILHSQELNQLETFQAIPQNKLAQAQVNALQAQVEAERRELNRYNSLLAEGAITAQRVDSIQSSVAKIEGELAVAQAELSIAEIAFSSAQTGQVYDGIRFVGDLPRLTADVQEASQEAQLAAQRVNILQQEQAQENLKLAQLVQEKQTAENTLANIENLPNKEAFLETYFSPVTGSVIEISKPVGGRTNRGDTLVLLQPETPRTTVEAYLTQDQAAQLEVAQSVEVIVPGLETIYMGNVLEIDRTGGFSQEITGRYAFEGSPDKPAYLRVELVNVPEAEESQLTAGMPVRVKAEKQIDIFNRLRFANW